MLQVTNEIRRVLFENDNVNGVGINNTPMGAKLFVIYLKPPTEEEIKIASDLVGGKDNLIYEVSDEETIAFDVTS